MWACPGVRLGTRKSDRRARSNNARPFNKGSRRQADTAASEAKEATASAGRPTHHFLALGDLAAGDAGAYLKAALGQMATGAAKTDTLLGERYRRLVKRMPKKEALAALQRSILVIIFHLLSDPTATFNDLGADFYTRRIDHKRRTDHLVRQLEALGHHVNLTPAA